MGESVTETISVPDVHCEHCVSSIEGALGPRDGIDQVTVDLDNRQVLVTFDPAALGLADIVTVIEDQGYDVPAS